jgi:small-conductance mechanosensitive channel
MYNASMNWLTLVLEWALPIVITLLIAATALWGVRRAIPDEPSTRMMRQLGSVAVVVLANIALVLALPLESETTGQLLSLFGLVITAVIALSSTTFVSNAMAGFMLRSVGGFHPGDFIRVGEHFGRVTEKGLLHTEIQSEDRDLVTLPNLYIMNQPVRVVRTSGTLISADVSLGYEVHRHQVRDLLKAAAEDAELTDPFVQITELGDHAVTYRVYGFLDEISNLVSKRTDLRGKMLDRLHGDGIEIVSPGFMNQRRVDGTTIIPRALVQATAEDSHAETLMFDKAEMAGRISSLRAKRDALKTEISALEESDAATAEQDIGWRLRQIDYLDDLVATLEKR